MLALCLALAAAPDVVLIMADDLGYGDLGCYHADNPLWPGAPPPSTPTPQLDRLAAVGTRLLDFHSNGSVCSPTRAALLTGRYQQRAGVGGVIFADPTQNRHHGLHPSERTLADALADIGYDTAVFGKWHLGYDVAFNPLENGFDVFRGYVSGNVDYVAHLDRIGIPDWWDGRRLIPEPGYTTDLITRYAADYLAPSDGPPRLCYVAHECPHDPIQAPGDPPVRRSGQVGNVFTPKGADRNDRRRRMIAAMDAGVGTLMDSVEASGRDTVFLFCSDNGAVPFGDNGPWRGAKGSLWEGGHRVPLLAARCRSGQWSRLEGWPADSTLTVLSMDLMPTICELAGADPGEPDGRSLVSLKPSGRRLFWAHRGEAVVRDGDFKLHRDRKGRTTLYSLAADPDESDPIDDPSMTRRLTAALDEWLVDVHEGATEQPTK